jgi:hypothetical protein
MRSSWNKIKAREVFSNGRNVRAPYLGEKRSSGKPSGKADKMGRVMGWVKDTS